MFFYTNQDINQTIQNNMKVGRRYNLDMMSRVRKRIKPLDKNEEKRNRIISLKIIEPTNDKWNEDNLEQIQLDEIKEKMKNLKILEPKNNSKWNEDIFEQIQLDKIKEKMKNLKMLEPKKEKNMIDYRLYISDWNDEQ